MFVEKSTPPLFDKLAALFYAQPMKINFTAVIKKEGRWYVAECIETGVTTQGKTVASAKKNLCEAMSLYLEDLPKNKVEKLRNQKSFVQPLNVEYA